MSHEHLNDEQLSAHLDGEQGDEPILAAAPDDTVEARIADCDACQQRLEALATARTLVRLPVAPVLPSVRAAAVEAAIAEGLATEGAVGKADGSAPAVTPLSTRRPRAVPVLVGAVAAVAVLVVAVGVSLALTHARSSTATSSAAPEASHSSTNGAAVATTTTPGPGAIPDLGSVTSVSALRARLAPVFALRSGATASTSAQGADGLPNNSAAAAPSPSAAATSGSVPSSFATCVARAEQAAGTADTLELVATVIYGHTPALVVVVHLTGSSSKASSDVLAVVVAQNGCQLLASTTP